MFVSDGAATIRLVSRRLKQEYGNFLDITCKLHDLHLVAEEIRRYFPNLNQLISSTKGVFFKSLKGTHQFHQHSDIPESPQKYFTVIRTSIKQLSVNCYKLIQNIQMLSKKARRYFSILALRRNYKIFTISTIQ